MYQILKPTIDDADAILQLRQKVWKDTYTNILGLEEINRMEMFDPLLYDQRYQKLIDKINNTAHIYYVMKKDDQLIAMLRGGDIRNKDSMNKKQNKKNTVADQEMYSIYLSKEYQGQGLGKKLFQFFVQQVIERGYKSFCLEVLKDNKKAQGFYRAMGGIIIQSKTYPIGDKKYPSVIFHFTC